MYGIFCLVIPHGTILKLIAPQISPFTLEIPKMLIQDYMIDMVFPSVHTLTEVQMTKLHYFTSEGWTTVHVPNDQILAQLRAWDEQGVDYSLPA